MTVVITHPDNLDALKRDVDAGKYDNDQFMPSIEVRTNLRMDRDKPTGRFILPSGETVERDEVRVEERFVVFGPEDVECLLFAGVIREEREALFYVMDDSPFRIRFDTMLMIQPQRLVKFC